MKQFTVALALFDFLPVILYFVSTAILRKDFYPRMSRTSYGLFAAGTIQVVFAGVCKVIYKLLYAMGVCDFAILSDMFFASQSFGFLLCGLGIIMMLFGKKKNTAAYAVAAPAVFKGTFLFISFMVFGLAVTDFCLFYIAKKMDKKKTMIIILISFVASLMMGYLSSKDFSQAYMNWIAECVNTIGQGLFLVGVVQLDKAGLKDAEL